MLDPRILKIVIPTDGFSARSAQCEVKDNWGPGRAAAVKRVPGTSRELTKTESGANLLRTFRCAVISALG